MRNEQAHEKTGTKELMVAGVIDLALVVAFVLSAGSAPAKHSTFSIESATPGAAESVSATPDSILPGEANADSDSLDLQLD